MLGALLLLGCQLTACDDGAPPNCPERAEAPPLLPGTRPEHERAEPWLATLARTHDLDAPVLDAEAIGAGRWGDPPAPAAVLAEPVDEDAVRRRIVDALTYVGERVAEGTYVEPDGRALAGAALAPFRRPPPLPRPLHPTLHVALAPVPIRCGPRLAPLRVAGSDDPRADANACGSAHRQEAVQVLAQWGPDLRLARTRYSLGWIAADAPLSTPVPADLVDAVTIGERVFAPEPVTLALPGGHVTLPPFTLLPLVPGHPERVLLGTAQGFVRVERPPAMVSTRRPLTRRAFVETALGFLGALYGYGGTGGGRDCSRLVMDVFDTFGLELPRASTAQAHAGSESIDVADVADPAEKQALLDAADRRGIVLLQFPGHIMLYLGRDAAGTPFVLHALGAYRAPCPGGGETRFDVRRVTVSPLTLGTGTEHGSLLERTQTLVLFAGA